MVKAFIGRFYTKQEAVVKAWRKHPLRTRLIILEAQNGYFLISKAQYYASIPANVENNALRGQDTP